MTLFATRVERHPNTPESVPEQIIVHTTYGPITNEVKEDIRHIKSFWADLGRLIESIENEKDV